VSRKIQRSSQNVHEVIAAGERSRLWWKRFVGADELLTTIDAAKVLQDLYICLLF